MSPDGPPPRKTFGWGAVVAFSVVVGLGLAAVHIAREPSGNDASDPSAAAPSADAYVSTPEHDAELRTFVNDVLTFTLLHEMGHIIFKQYDVPVGSSDTNESAADGLAADGGLSEQEKQAAYAQFAVSGTARAELQSAIDLLAAVEKAPQRPSAQLMAQAAALLVTEKKSPAPAKIWQWLKAPDVRLASGLAFAVLVALLVWNPAAQIAPQTSGSSPASPAGGDTGQRALFGGAVPIIGTATPPSSGTWGAIAISRTAKIYGVTRDAPTRDEAEKAALLDCRAQHGADCVVAVSGQGQCFALARQPGGVPVAAMADDVREASRRAMTICTSGRTEFWPCVATTAFCSGG